MVRTARQMRLRRWETALLLGLATALLFALWLEGQQSRLASEVLRLHVIANSDSDGDQSLKLEVRDAVLAKAVEYTADANSAQAAWTALEPHLEELAAAGQMVADMAGEDVSVAARLTTAYFPTKEYDGFSLPAGRYQALQVTIGAGEGHNWWCVIYPALCVVPVSEQTETALSSGLGEEDARLITQDGTGYVIRFKCLELWGELRHWAAGLLQ